MFLGRAVALYFLLEGGGLWVCGSFGFVGCFGVFGCLFFFFVGGGGGV